MQHKYQTNRGYEQKVYLRSTEWSIHTLVCFCVCYLSKAFTFTSAGCKILSYFDTAVFQEVLFKKSMLLLKINILKHWLVVIFVKLKLPVLINLFERRVFYDD